MNGIEKIIARIRQDAQAEIDALMEQARSEAAGVEENFRREAQAEAEALAAKAQKAAAEREERMVSSAQMEKRKRLLAARQEMVDQVYETALEELCALPHKTYVETLTALLLRASTNGKEEVVFSKADRERVGEEAVAAANARGKQLTLSEETRPIRGGFILKNGRVEINCSFETLMHLQKSQSAAEVAAILFPAGSEGTA